MDIVRMVQYDSTTHRHIVCVWRSFARAEQPNP